MSSESEQAGLLRKILQSSSYRLAQEDKEFLASEDLRPVRLQLEFLKPKRYLREHNVRSTIVVFGSARLLPPDHAEARLEVLERRADPALKAEIARARKQLEYSRYYVEARHFAKIVSRRFQKEGRRDFVVVTGGGPGIMEAANRGAYDAGERSIGLNVTLPHEQAPNPFVTPELCFQFRYFGLRKMHFLLRARGLVAFPGGFGTLDELFETLTLMQTKKVATMPVVLVGQQFWSRVIDFNFLLEEGMIDKEDLKLFSIVDSADEAITVLCDFYQGTPPE
ncbi:TIGR00730 family Rossman fold protein [Sedimenticola selenatireducens]|uniref:LOG family protein n=1 Tax=Sedimenticola selenatireducens TaxID=191960 RepID=UPI002AABBACA|nr:TIGR00730 family Rossman fold protein [Sedimenticola selenatireducens]